MQKYDVLVAGELNPDLILSTQGLEPRFDQQETLLEDAHLVIGSSSAIFACAAARLGLKVIFAGLVGSDLFGRFMLASLEECDINVSPVIVDANLKTGLSVILNRGTDRAILTHLGAIASLEAAQVTDELLSKARHLHIASYFLQVNLQPGLPDLLRRAHSLGLTISLDTNWDPEGQWSQVQPLLPKVDIFFPNQAEALALTGSNNISQATRILNEAVPALAIKLGEEGALAVHGGKAVRVRPPSMQVVDTVGAGDCFDAGFLYGYLKGWPLEQTLKLGVALGSLSTRAPGGTSAQPSLQEAQDFAHNLLAVPDELALQGSQAE
jgi:sugar/nucleoside kinase (ribokinase family)